MLVHFIRELGNLGSARKVCMEVVWVHFIRNSDNLGSLHTGLYWSCVLLNNSKLIKFLSKAPNKQQNLAYYVK